MNCPQNDYSPQINRIAELLRGAAPAFFEKVCVIHEEGNGRSSNTYWYIIDGRSQALTLTSAEGNLINAEFETIYQLAEPKWSHCSLTLLSDGQVSIDLRYDNEVRPLLDLSRAVLIPENAILQQIREIVERIHGKSYTEIHILYEKLSDGAEYSLWYFDEDSGGSIDLDTTDDERLYDLMEQLYHDCRGVWSQYHLTLCPNGKYLALSDAMTD